MRDPSGPSASDRAPPILIVGAGPTGLTLAAGLAQQGVPFRLIDDELGPSHRTRAVLLQPRSLEVLDDLGLAESVSKEAHPLVGLTIHACPGPGVDIDLDSLDSTYPFPMAIPQDRLEARLLEHLAAQGIEVDRGVRLEGLDPGVGGAEVRLVPSDRGAETVRFDHVVGCDGRYSTTRELAGIDVQASHSALPVVLADVDLADGPPTDRLTVCFRDAGVLTLIPMPRPHRYRLAIVENGDRAEDWAPTEETLQDLLDTLFPGSATLETMAWGALWQPDPAVARTFRKGPILLAGDAAHAHLPLGAQGMNTGIQDAHALAWRLAHIDRDQVPDLGLLDTYARERRRTALATKAATDRLAWLAWGTSKTSRLARHRLVPWLLDRDRIQDQVAGWLSQTRIRYAGSPLSVDRLSLGTRMRHPGRLRAGDRIPEAVLGRPDGSYLRLHEEIAGPGHVLLLLVGQRDNHPTIQGLGACGEVAIERLGSAVNLLWIQPLHDRRPHGPGGEPRFQGLHAAREGPIRYRSDPEAYLHRRLGAHGPMVCLVRPDGHIAAIQRPPQPGALDAYLDRWYRPLPEPEEPDQPAEIPAGPQGLSKAPPAPELGSWLPEEQEALARRRRRQGRQRS